MWLYQNTNHLCGNKEYAIVMADKTVNTNTAYLNLQNPGISSMQIYVQSNSPSHKTNANVQYYLAVTLSDYVYRYPTEAVYYQSFNLNMRNCEVKDFNIGSWITD